MPAPTLPAAGSLRVAGLFITTQGLFCGRRTCLGTEAIPVLSTLLDWFLKVIMEVCTSNFIQYITWAFVIDKQKKAQVLCWIFSLLWAKRVQKLLEEHCIPFLISLSPLHLPFRSFEEHKTHRFPRAVFTQRANISGCRETRELCFLGNWSHQKVFPASPTFRQAHYHHSLWSIT